MDYKFKVNDKWLSMKELFEENCGEVIADLRKKNKDLEKRLAKQEDKLNFITKHNNYLLWGVEGEKYREEVFIPTRKTKYKIGDYVLYRTIDRKHLKPALIFKIDVYEYSHETRYHVRLENGDEFACGEEWIEGYAKKFKPKPKVLLTKEERHYLCKIIKSFRDKISYVRKTSSYLYASDNEDIAFFHLRLGYPYQFKHLSEEKHYTLDELGL